MSHKFYYIKINNQNIILLKCKRERKELLLNPNASSIHEHTTTTHEKICLWSINSSSSFIIYGDIHDH